MFGVISPLIPVLQLPGVIGALVVDSETGAIHERAGFISLDMETMASENASLILAQMRAARATHPREGINDVLITLETQYHLIHPLKGKDAAGLFLYVALEKSRTDLPLSRHRINIVATVLTV